MIHEPYQVHFLFQEFRVLKCSGDNPVDPTEPCEEFPALARVVSGLWATILAVGTVATSMLMISARSWRFFKVRCPDGSCQCCLKVAPAHSLR